jgi:hypothetical protein
MHWIKACGARVGANWNSGDLCRCLPSREEWCELSDIIMPPYVDKYNAVADRVMHCTLSGYYCVSFHIPQKFCAPVLKAVLLEWNCTQVLMRNSVWRHKNLCSIINFLVRWAPHHEASRSVRASGQLHVRKLYPTIAHWQAWWAMVSRTRNPYLKRKSTSVARPARRHFRQPNTV